MLPPRRELSFVFTWPRSLTAEGRKCGGHARVTLAYTPPLDAAFDAECQRVQLEAHLYQLEEKEKDGEAAETRNLDYIAATATYQSTLPTPSAICWRAAEMDTN
jgi:hypothetical protein